MSQSLYRVHRSPLISAAKLQKPSLWLARRGAVLGTHGSTRGGCMGGEAENSSAGHSLTPFLGKRDNGLLKWRQVQRRRQLMDMVFV
jgi:hypothetical protein